MINKEQPARLEGGGGHERSWRKVFISCPSTVVPMFRTNQRTHPFRQDAKGGGTEFTLD